MMKNQKLAQVQSNHYIPSDLYPEILSRLPVKSLLRFRCVAKSWLALVDDADFAQLHLNNFKNNTDGTHLLVVHNNLLNCVVRRSDNFEAIPGALGTIPALGSAHYSDREWFIVCSVDGLILLERYIGLHTSSDLQVWNPSIRKFLQLPSFPENLGSFLRYVVIGLGYDILAKEYKLALLVFVDSTTSSLGTPTSVLTYTFGADSWKIVEFQVKGGSTFVGRFLSKFWPRIYFQGCLYITSGKKKLVVFDLSTQVFSTINSPEFRSYCWTMWGLVDGGRSLAIFGTDTRRKNCIWVLQTESMSWTKRYAFQLKCFQILYLKNNCDVLVMRRCAEKIAPENEGKKKETRWDQVVVYNPETDEYKNLDENRSSSSNYLIHCMCGYVESLVLHKSICNT